MSKYAYESLPVSEPGVAEITKIREQFKALDQLISSGVVKDGRYLAIAKTHLETAAMFVVKSITHCQVHDERQSKGN
jgi:hypothetical protein